MSHSDEIDPVCEEEDSLIAHDREVRSLGLQCQQGKKKFPPAEFSTGFEGDEEEPND